MKISELRSTERPRERLFEKGPEALSDAELIAVLLRTGTRSQSALEIAQALVSSKSLPQISSMSAESLFGIPGIGSGKAASLAAAFELGRRTATVERSAQIRKITDARDICRLLEPRLRSLDHEESWLVLMDSACRVKDMVRLSVGEAAFTSFDPKRAVKIAIEKKAQSLILVHNHPSGNPRPSRSDVELTRQLHSTCQLCEIAFMDHIVYSDRKAYSFSEETEFIP